MNKLILFLLICASTATFAQETFKDFSQEDQEALKDASVALVKAQLMDPYSAKFSQVTLGEFGVCGRVNARNAFGAYTGAKLFVTFFSEKAEGLDSQIASEPGEAVLVQLIMQKVCPSFLQ